MTRNDILTELFKSPLLDDIIINITGGNILKEDLKSELFLILMEMPEVKIIEAYNNRWLNYLCINILTKQWRSNTSPFYKNFKRESKNEEIKDIEDDDIKIDYEAFNKIIKAIEVLPFVERELFKMRYKLDRYDKWFGDLRDENCKKEIYSYKKIEKKLQLETKSHGKPITICHSTVHLLHKKSIKKIKKIIKNE
jgi:hypothetical protein